MHNEKYIFESPPAETGGGKLIKDYASPSAE
jgi:hypothetical protein